MGPEPSRKSTYSLPSSSQTWPPRPSRMTMSAGMLPKLPPGRTRFAVSMSSSSGLWRTLAVMGSSCVHVAIVPDCTAKRGSAATLFRSGPDGGDFEGEAAGAPHQIHFEVDVFRRPIGEGLGPHADEAIAEPPLHRAQGLPLQAVERIPRRMRLRHRGAGELLAPIVVVALGAGEVELSLPLLKEAAAPLDEGTGAGGFGNGLGLAL